MLAGQFPGDVIGTNVAATVHRQQLVSFDPNNSQVSLPTTRAWCLTSGRRHHRVQTAFRPEMKWRNATNAAVLSTTKVKAASAARVRVPSLSFAGASKLRA